MKLYTAVLLSIKKFDGKQFSIYDIAKDIRESLKNGAISISDVSDELYSGMPCISRDAVKSIIEEIPYSVIPLTVSHKVENGVSYRLFSFPATVSVYTSANTQAVTQTPVAAPVVALSSTVNKSNKVAIEAINNYLSNIKDLNPVVTVKQIQSALKKHNLLCRDIYDLVNLNDNGSYSTGFLDYNDESKGYYSKAIVKIS